MVVARPPLILAIAWISIAATPSYQTTLLSAVVVLSLCVSVLPVALSLSASTPPKTVEGTQRPVSPCRDSTAGPTLAASAQSLPHDGHSQASPLVLHIEHLPLLINTAISSASSTRDRLRLRPHQSLTIRATPHCCCSLPRRIEHSWLFHCEHLSGCSIHRTRIGN